MISAREIRTDEYISYDQMNVLVSIQKLWFKLGVLARTYINAAVYNTPNLQSVSTSLLDLPQEAYNLFILFYGPDIAENIKGLLFDFIATMIEVIDNKTYGDKTLSDLKIIQWYQNADKLSSYLSRINVYWDEEQWKYLLYQYIRLTINQIESAMNVDNQVERQIYTAIENLNFIIANYMGRGIIASQQSTRP